MKVLVAPGNFKGSLSAERAALAIDRGLKKACPGSETLLMPVTDGGEGFCRIVTRAMNGRIRKISVAGPTGLPDRAAYGIVQEPRRKARTAIIELAQAAGLSLIKPGERNPNRTSTTGAGELFLEALDRNCEKIIVGVGDTATIDCAMGALSRLGVKFLDRENKPVPPNAFGLQRLDRIDVTGLDPRTRKVGWLVCGDVDNRLTGPSGALMFARQKGASRRMIGEIARGLRNFRRVLLRQFKFDPDSLPGSGAAGGFPAGMAAILKAKTVPGFDFFQKLNGLDNKIKNCDLVITGEGRFDEQSVRGKAVYRMIELARKNRKPAVCIVGSLSKNMKIESFGNYVKFLSLRKPGMSLKESISQAEDLITRLANFIGVKSSHYTFRG